MKKHITTLMILTLLVTKLFAAMPFFSGYAGLLTNLSLDEDGADFNPIITTETFFNGQLDFSGIFMLRGEFFLQTNDQRKKIKHEAGNWVCSNGGIPAHYGMHCPVGDQHRPFRR